VSKKNRSRPVKNHKREYPYKTRAVLGKDDRLKDVTILGPARSAPYAVPSSLPKGKYHYCMRLVTVMVSGEGVARDIAAERLEDEP